VLKCCSVGGVEGVVEDGLLVKLGVAKLSIWRMGWECDGPEGAMRWMEMGRANNLSLL